MNGKIVVVGSSNTDFTIKMNEFPKCGETVIGNDYVKSFGGKGANQAVAAARAGAPVTFITKMGNDDFGKKALENYANEGIEIKNILLDDESKSGIAMIWVDGKGENSIVVAPGANNKLNPDEIENKKSELTENDILIVQLEIPIETVEKAIEIAHQKKACVILNPAPANNLSDDILSKVNILTPNIHELESLSKMKVKEVADIKAAAQFLNKKGIENVVVTNGKIGAYLSTEKEFIHISSFKVQAVDTTAAGDILNGVLAASLMEGKSIKDALTIASAAAAISVTKVGAQITAPHKNEIIKFLQENEVQTVVE